MGFERTHKVVTYLLVATGFSVLLLSGELPTLYGAVFIPVVIASWWLGGTDRSGSTRFWNTLLIAALGGLLALAMSTGDWLRNAVYFASLMVTAKLYQKKLGRDYFQLYALSFLQLVAGAVINPTLWFAVCFLLYVVFVTWALVLLHLLRDMESLALQAGEDIEAGQTFTFGALKMRRLIGPGFLFGTSALALVIFASSIVVFLFFPRLGLGFFGQHKNAGTNVSGFDSNGMQLGHFGMLKQDQTVIMRVEIDGATVRDVLPLRLKGISFDRYGKDDSGTFKWDKSNRTVWQLARTDGPFMAVHHWGAVPPEALHFTQRVFLEQLQIDRKTIFGEARVVGVRDLLDDRYVFNPRKRTRFFVDEDDDVIFSSRTQGAALRYEVKSIRVPRLPERLRGAGTDYHGSLDRYLQLPPGLDGRIRQKARDITSAATNPYDAATAIERHLLTEYGYSLEGGHDPSDPLADFLFGRKTGHCEYFAAAFVILARARGIPARVVGGFYGGEYNDAGDYVAVRQADAHSWAEVWFPGYGWMVFDATPPSGALVGPEEGWWADLMRYFDSMELQWYKWVIRWDLERQLDFLRSIGEKLDGVGEILPSGDMGESFDRLKAWLGSARGQLGALAVVVLLGLVVWRYRSTRFGRIKGRTKRARPVSAADIRRVRKLYARLLKLASRRGITVKPSTSGGSVLRLLHERSPYAAEQAAPVVHLYQDVVFGGSALDAARLKVARDQLNALKKAS